MIISIHVLRMEDDAFHNSLLSFRTHFNPRPPHGGRLDVSAVSIPANGFQSTSSAWRTTYYTERYYQTAYYFNPRPPHGGRLDVKKHGSNTIQISIHVLRMEDDWLICRDGNTSRLISIHVLRMEDDDGNLRPLAKMGYFNPRPPHGGRRSRSILNNTINLISIHVLRMEDDFLLLSCNGINEVFQSTSSAWRTTIKCK